jgi:hypothetical protein
MKRKNKKKGKLNALKKVESKNFNLMLLVTFFLGVLLIFSAYAWFYASLDVQVKFVNLVVSKKNGLFISLDGVEFGSSVQISKENLINNLKRTYPGNTSKWAKFGLYPISSNGIPNSNTDKFDMYFASNFDVDQINKKSYLSTRKNVERGISDHENYIAFDLFLKNITGSPVSDNLYIDEGTGIVIDSEETEQIKGLVNSSRIGFVKVGSVSNKATVNEIQSIECNNNCEMVIYEPNSTTHTELSIERAKSYGINLINGQYYPTHAVVGEMDFFEITDVIKGNLKGNFELQTTRIDIERPIFEIPDGITKVRVYVWLEGQDIDSLATRSEGADVSVIINLIKDTAGYDAFNE